MWTAVTTARSASRSGLEYSFASTSRATNASRRVLRSTRRTLATEAPSTELSEEAIDASASPSPPRTLPYTLYTSLILARAPLLTKTPTPLENSYYAYQARIQRALSTPFPSEFYFKKGTLLERRFLAEERVREQAAFGEGFDGEEGAEKLEDVPSEEDEVNLLSREHEADRKGDPKDLNRQGERNLYLLVKSKEAGSWRFPVWNAGLEQPLHKNVQEGLVQSFGPDMNTWMVARHPIGVINESQASPSKTFFFKGRILGGRPDISSQSTIADLAWLTKEEIAERVDGSYWTSVQDLIPRV